MLERMLGTAKLDVKVINEIEGDTNATSQAAAVVVLVAIASGIGAIGYIGVWGLLSNILLGVIGWAVFAALVYWIGTTFFREASTHADWGQLARVLGFAQAPGLLWILGIIPVLGAIISFLVWIWVIVASVIATREALDYSSTVTAVIVVVLAYIPYFIAFALLGALL